MVPARRGETVGDRRDLGRWGSKAQLSTSASGIGDHAFGCAGRGRAHEVTVAAHLLPNRCDGGLAWSMLARCAGYLAAALPEFHRQRSCGVADTINGRPKAGKGHDLRDES